MGLEPENANQYTLLADSLFNKTYQSKIDQMIAELLGKPAKNE